MKHHKVQFFILDRICWKVKNEKLKVTIQPQIHTDEHR